MSYGLYFEEFEVGRHFQHPLGRTITEHDDTLFSLMTMNQHPVHIDEHYAAATQHGRRLVVGPACNGAHPRPRGYHAGDLCANSCTTHGGRGGHI